MEDKNVLIICITIILCVVIVAGTLIVLNINGSLNSNTQAISTASSNDNSQEVSSANTGISDIYWVEFYSDGNPGTGEDATIYVGTEHSNEDVEVSLSYSRDGSYFNPGEYQWRSVSEDGTINVYIGSAMNKYPDKCEINLRQNGNIISKTCYLEKRKGTQKVTF